MIRSALTSDIPNLIALSRRTISASYRSFLGDDAVDGFIGSGAADEYVRESIDRCTVMLRDDEVVGYSVTRDDLIDLLMIDHAAHGEGLGTTLLHHVEGRLFERYDVLELESFEGNSSANAFYERNGWRETRRYFDEESGGNKIVFTKSDHGGR